MPRQGKSSAARVKGAIGRAVKKVRARLRPAKKQQAQRATPARKRASPRAVAGTARPTRRKTDIPLDVLGRTYTPTQTSLKASFRTDGEDRQRDQELAGGYADERWKDEDHYTNKSGDPRIGTHHRTYEPNE
jgi:hypothetical protein